MPQERPGRPRRADDQLERLLTHAVAQAVPTSIQHAQRLARELLDTPAGRHLAAVWREHAP